METTEEGTGLSADEPRAETYAGAPESLITAWNFRRRPLGFTEGEALPPPDADLAALLFAIVPADEAEAPLPPRASPHAQKRHEIRREFAGQSELAALNGLLIAHLRKRRQPADAAALFLRIWTEHGPALIAQLSPRWLISSAITFGDHGATEAQRRIGLAMNVMFSLLKLAEFERLQSGTPADQPWKPRRAKEMRMPLDMPGFALVTGGLDINFLAQIWEMAQAEPVCGPIAERLLVMLNEDPAGLFRRLNLMRDDLMARRAAKAAPKV